MTFVGDWIKPLRDMRDRLRNAGDASGAMNKVADQVVLPAMRRNYHAAGIGIRTGKLIAGVSERGAIGNYVRITGRRLTVGVSTQAIPYAKWVLEGRGSVVARKAKALRFEINGKVVFRKRVGPARARPVHYLTDGDREKAQQVFTDAILGDLKAR